MTIIKPDYIFWSKLDVWKFKEAAFLLHGLDPLQYKSIRLTSKDLPKELENVYKTYLILSSINWRDYPGYAYNGVHPFTILLEVHKKELGMPKELRDLLVKDYERMLALEKENQLDKNKEIQKNNHEEFSLRERRNFLKSLGLLVKILVEQKDFSDYRHGQKPNANRIAQMLIEKAESLDLETEGLKSINRKITEAINLLEEDSGFHD